MKRRTYLSRTAFAAAGATLPTRSGSVFSFLKLSPITEYNAPLLEMKK